ncbi:MAG: CoA transferase subunit A, partial [Candidatus Limnocylindria bacterium]
QGYYDRDNAFYRDWDAISRDPTRLDGWLDQWVRGVPDRAAYVEKLGAEVLAGLRPGPRPSGSVDYGEYR